ncbi:MAG: hypothetical protein QME42_01615 [bacterium]|nr:hypothetical protein [bacterium]
MLKCLLTKEDKIHVAHCLDLDLIAEGDTKEESLTNIKLAIEDYLSFVAENKLEQELIPRFAPLKYWKQYFESVKKPLIEDYRRNHSLPQIESVERVVYG